MSLIVGLTGGIGSGKSAVAQVFSLLGCPVYNSDARAKEMYYADHVKREIMALLGAGAYHPNGTLNKKFVADKIFSDARLRQNVNAVIHPAVAEDMNVFFKEHRGHKIIIKETALLFEAGLAEKVDKVILVTAPLELKIKRVQERDAISYEAVEARIKSQWPDSVKIPKSDVVIENDEVHAVIPQALAAYNKLLHV
jgi:dephospho-CoA kinase